MIFMNNFFKWIKKNKYFTIALSVTVTMFVIICVALATSDTYKPISTDDMISNEKNSDTEPSSDDMTSENISETPSETTDGNFHDTTIAEGDQNGEEDTTSPEQETPKPEDYPYLVKVNRVMNCVTVYKKDENNEFTIPYKALVCSTGKNVDDTPLGTFTTSGKYEWCRMVDNTYGQYAYRIDGPIMFHSVPSYVMSKDSLETEQFNMLGEVASLGCIRLNVRDAKWLFDNCPSGTTVIIYDDKSSPGPLGKPATIKIPTDHPYSGWDPFDPDPANPWNTMMPKIKGAKDKTFTAGKNVNLLKGVTAKDSCLNDVTSQIKILGSIDTQKPGKYKVTYSITDLLGRKDEVTVTITIKKGKNNPTEKTTKKETVKETTSKKPTVKETTSKKETVKETTTKKPVIKETTTKKETVKETTSERPQKTTPNETAPEETTPEETTEPMES